MMKTALFIGCISLLLGSTHAVTTKRTMLTLPAKDPKVCNGQQILVEYKDDVCFTLDGTTGPLKPILQGLKVPVKFVANTTSSPPNLALTAYAPLGDCYFPLKSISLDQGVCTDANIPNVSLSIQADAILPVVPTPVPVEPTLVPGEQPLQGIVTLADFKLTGGFGSDCNSSPPFHFEVENDKCVKLGNATEAGLPVDAAVYARFTCFEHHMEYTLSLTDNCDPRAPWEGFPVDLPDHGALVEGATCKEDWMSLSVDQGNSMKVIVPIYAKYSACFRSTGSPSSTDTPTNAPQTDAPKTAAPPTAAPTTLAPKTESPPTTSPKTEIPTPAPDTTAPATLVPGMTWPPATSSPPTNVPTLAPITPSPVTTAPATTAPATTAPVTTAPATTAPATTAPATTVPGTLAPGTTWPPTTSSPPTGTPTAAPDTSAPATMVPQTLVPGSTWTPPTAAPETMLPTATPTSAPNNVPGGAGTVVPTPAPSSDSGTDWVKLILGIFAAIAAAVLLIAIVVVIVRRTRGSRREAKGHTMDANLINDMQGFEADGDNIEIHDGFMMNEHDEIAE
eukprot:TRINITY_DN2122_c0_g1_i1.p1 TRINITY_DN2122_c0_g1~~TRINITY_DN2122_c0_g1_i1.p1  ORF type:complete len:591 (+),score=119.84 TRINITY_DN2122_c0_g1_i1:85-1773(+)